MTQAKFPVGTVVVIDDEGGTVKTVTKTDSGFTYEISYNDMPVLIAVDVPEDQLEEFWSKHDL